jgi:putative spermidine/putrescine transport system substrate-binding protein
MKTNPALGIKDPYELNEAQYKAVLGLLRKQRQIVGRYWHDAFVQIDDFTNEGVVVSGSWQFQANILASKKRPIATVVPEEGATGWADTTMMHIESKHPNCAYMWLEHSLNKKLQGDLSAWFGSVPVVLEACKGNPLLGEKGCEARGLGSFEKIRFWRTPTAKCASHGEGCVPYYRWVSDYIAILGGR